ncbi:hypothetical protein LTR27_012173 [Elasticomyces elasticus]|nr:hypothetical protein LTR27_012173 [Elasticomyces elasticus]
MAPSPSHPRESYTVGIICALDVEKAVVEATLDEEHGGVEKMAGDDNSYRFGRIGQHDVFPIKAGFMVGIGGGVWSDKADVRLGDVVVSQPDEMHGGVVQWNFGKMEKEGLFRGTGTLNKPPRPLLGAVQSLKARHLRYESEVEALLMEIWRKYPRMAKKFQYPGAEHDSLFEAAYAHPRGDTCDNCDRSRVVQHRLERADNTPQIHYGNIASGDEVMKDGPTRDRIAREKGV